MFQSIATNLYVLGGLTLYFASAAVWLFVLAKVDVSFAYPFVGLGFIEMMLLAFFINGEVLSTTKIVCTLCIAIGVMRISVIAIGFWALLTVKEHLAFRLTLGLTIIGQLLLHMVYCEETFLYSLHFLPLLIALVVLVTISKMRSLIILLILILILTAIANNWMKFQAFNKIMVALSKIIKKFNSG